MLELSFFRFLSYPLKFFSVVLDRTGHLSNLLLYIGILEMCYFFLTIGQKW